MPDRFEKYLDEMDMIREDSTTAVDDFLKSLNIDAIINNPDQSLKTAVLYFIKKNNELFLKGRLQGKKLAEKLKNNA